MVFNHTGPCTIQSFLPTNCTSLPDTGNPGQMPKWQLSCLYKSNARVFIRCGEVVMYKVWGIRTLHVLRGVCVRAALGTLRCSSRIQDSGYRLQLVRCLSHTPFFFFSICKSVCDCWLLVAGPQMTSILELLSLSGILLWLECQGMYVALDQKDLAISSNTILY